jgi:hypothetical protein
MHIVVWEFYNGKVPKGHQIHHVDENKSNNSIENLRLMTAKEHLSMHMTEEKKDRARIHAEKIRPLTKKWHASEDGRKWHKEHGIITWDAREPFEGVCDCCGEKFVTKTFHQMFCSNKCKSAHRRKSGIDNIEVACEYCKKVFSKNKYAKRTSCSRSCGCKLAGKKKNKINKASGE